MLEQGIISTSSPTWLDTPSIRHPHKQLPISCRMLAAEQSVAVVAIY